MLSVKYVVYRYLIYADYFNMYKPAGAESRGGGQTYIDFGIGPITLEDWRNFFHGASRLGLKTIDLPIRYQDHTYGTTNIQRWKHGWLLLKMVFFAAQRVKFFNGRDDGVRFTSPAKITAI